MPTAVREKPILFSGPMVRALLDGRKTMTRRVVKPQPYSTTPTSIGLLEQWHWKDSYLRVGDPLEWLMEHKCPYGSVGDRFWVREAFARPAFGDSRRDTPMRSWPVVYRADVGIEMHLDFQNYRMHDTDFRWHPSIHMKRIESRITLEIENIRVERLQDISEEDAKAEGPTPKDCGDFGLEKWSSAFRNLWIDINGPGSWEANPFVWCLSFRKV